MTSAMVLTEDEALELLAFLVTAARTQLEEAAEYGPLRMQVTAEMLRVLRGEKPHVLGNPDLWPKLGHLR